MVCFVLSAGSHTYLSVISVAEKFNRLLPLKHLKFIGLGEQVKSLLYNVKKNNNNCTSATAYDAAKRGGRERWQDQLIFLEQRMWGIMWLLACVCKWCADKVCGFQEQSSRTDAGKEIFLALALCTLPKNLWHLHLLATFRTALLFHSTANPWASLDFLGVTINHFVSHKNKKSPRRDKLLSLLQSRNSSGADYFMGGDILVVPLRSPS